PSFTRLGIGPRPRAHPHDLDVRVQVRDRPHESAADLALQWNLSRDQRHVMGQTQHHTPSAAQGKGTGWLTGVRSPSSCRPMAQSVGNSILDVTNLTRTYVSGDRRLDVLRNVSFRVEPGETVAIVGPS